MFKKIGVKLIVAVGLATIIIIGVYSYINIRSQSEVYIKEVERHVSQLSETIKKSTRFDMLANRREHIYNIINTIGQESSIRDVRVLNKEGEIIYSTNPEDINQMVDKHAESCYACHAENQPLQKLSIEERTRIFQMAPDSGRVMGIINPIYNEKSCWEADCHAHPEKQTVLGVLDITVYLTPVDEQIKSSEVKVVIFAIIAILALSTIIGIFVKRWVDKPVKELVKATNHVAVGNLNYTIAESENDELGALAKSFNNMTKKLSEMRLQLFQSEKMASLGQLAAGVAHEINNPLTGVLTYSSYLLKRNKGNKELQEDLNVIVRETKRSREIVKGLLDFARQSTPKKGSVNVHEVIERAVSVVNNQLKLNKVKLEYNFAENLPEITADANQIQQIFLNLLVNSNDAIGSEGGSIKIDTKEISLSPYGITQIKRAACRKNHSLIDDEHKIEGMSSIKVLAKVNGNEGYIHLDPIYGKHRNHFGISLPKNKPVTILCPECNNSLIDETKKCPECGSAVFQINVPNQGEYESCTNFACNWEKWDFVDQGGKKKFIQINFSDNGCGMPQETMNKIFDPFYTTKGQKGTGLGLSVVWGIVDNHNGKIEVNSKVGEGTKFTIRLPIT